MRFLRPSNAWSRFDLPGSKDQVGAILGMIAGDC